MFTILLSVILIVICLWWRKDNNYWRNRNIVQVDNVLWKFVFGKVSLAEVYKQVYDEHPKESYVGFFLGSRPALLLREVEDIQAVLASDFQSFYSRGIQINKDDILADNVLFIEDFARWKLIRTKLSPVFTTMKLKNMFYILNRCGTDFVDLVKNNPNIESPFHVLYNYTTASIAASIFGIDTQSRTTMDSPFVEMAWKATEPSKVATYGFVIGSLFPKLVNYLGIKLFKKHEDFFIGVVKSVLESRKGSTDKRYDFIETCLELQNQGMMKDPTTGLELKPTDELLAAQAFFFFVAGADTSANTMHFTLIELANHPDILNKVHVEIDKIFEDCNEELTYFDIDKMKYLDMVVNEAMRKYPPIGLITRICTADTTLPVGKVNLKKDDLVILPVYGIHRDEKYFPDPDVFDPERFSPENVSNVPKFGYLAFGEGNRICLGMRFARLQVKAGLAWLLRRYTLKEQSHTPELFEPSVFSLRSTTSRYDFLPREETKCTNL